MACLKLLISILLFAALTFPFHEARPEALPVALVYFGPAVCKGCPQALAKVINDSGFTVRKIYAGGITANALKDAKIFAIPGGDDVDDLMKALSANEQQVIRDFVAGGGNYLGVCLGAYVASKDELKLFDGEINAHSKTIEARMEDISWRGQNRWMYFQDGPEFSIKAKDSAEIWALYRDGAISALQQSYGKGRLGLVGPHLEADQSWLDEDELLDQDGDDSEYMVEFIKALSHH